MSLQRRINRAGRQRVPAEHIYGNTLYRSITAKAPENAKHKPDKGLANGSCNRAACQLPLADEPIHQFMEGTFTGGPRLHYCEKCARDFDRWDHSSGDRVRITREVK